jgi:hypothetical protein
MNSKFGGPGWDRTNDQPIMSPDETRPRRSSDVHTKAKHPPASPICPPSSGNVHSIGSQLWQSRFGAYGSETTAMRRAAVLPNAFDTHQ